MKLLYGVLGVSLGASAFLLALVLLLPRLRRTIPARWRCLMWLLLAARLVLPLGGWPERAAIRIALPAPPEASAFAAAGPPVRAGDGEAGPPQAGENRPARRQGPWLAAIWFSGAAVLMGMRFACYLRYRREVERWEIAPDPRLRARFGELGEQLGVRARLICSRRVESPAAAGFIVPVVLLPASFRADEAGDMALRHELCHCRRRDVWKKLLLTVANALHWFNPLVWWMACSAERDLEYDCDDDVVRGRGMNFRRRYGGALLGQARSARATPMSVGLRPGGAQAMRWRLENIMRGDSVGGVWITAAALLTVCAVLCGSAVALTQRVPLRLPVPTLLAAPRAAVLNDPVLQGRLSTPEDLLRFAALVREGGVFRSMKWTLMNDIDLAGVCWTPVGAAADDAVPAESRGFCGVFDGQGHTISGLEVQSAGDAGFFALIGEGGKVQDLHLSGSIRGGGTAGGIAGSCGVDGRFGAFITGCSFTGSVTGAGAAAGGLAGDVRPGSSLRGCSTDAAVTGAFRVGGLCGSAGDGTFIEDCRAGGSVACVDARTAGEMAGYAPSGDGVSFAGGLTGTADGASIARCAALSRVSAPEEAEAWTGSLAGFMDGRVSSCTYLGDLWHPFGSVADTGRVDWQSLSASSDG